MVIRMLYATVMVASVTTSVLFNTEEDYDQIPISLEYSRSVPWDGFPSESLSFDAFGRRYKMPINHVDKRHADGVTVYVGTGGEFREEQVPDDLPFDIYQNDDSLMAITKRQTGVNEWQVDVDGWFRDGDDQVFLESQPWMDSSVKRHLASRNKRTETHDDYMYALDSTDAYIRSQRTTDTNRGVRAVVDLLVVVDNAVYRKATARYGGHSKGMAALKKYYRVLVALIDIRYAEIDDPDFDIRVRLAKLFVAKDRMSSTWSEYNVRRLEDDPREMAMNPVVGLEAFKDWLAEQNDRSLKGIQWDHAMAFTGYVLSSHNKLTTGLAFVGTICQTSKGFSSSILTERGGFVNAGTAVHELAHSLGSKHDGSSDNSECPAAENYIMAPFNTGNPDVLANYFLFSPCSLKGFRNTISDDKASCLRDSRSPGMLRGSLPGEKYDPDKQCQDVFGPQSGKCKNSGFQDPEDICVRLWCQNPKRDSCVTKAALSALYGTPCGEDKICKQGRCILKGEERLEDEYDDNVNSVNAAQSLDGYDPAPVVSNVIDGMAKEPTNGKPCYYDKDRMYCYRVVASSPDYCERPDIGEYCCFSCQHARRA